MAPLINLVLRNIVGKHDRVEIVGLDPVDLEHVDQVVRLLLQTFVLNVHAGGAECELVELGLEGTDAYQILNDEGSENGSGNLELDGHIFFLSQG